LRRGRSWPFAAILGDRAPAQPPCPRLCGEDPARLWSRGRFEGVKPRAVRVPCRLVLASH